MELKHIDIANPSVWPGCRPDLVQEAFTRMLRCGAFGLWCTRIKKGDASGKALEHFPALGW